MCVQEELARVSQEHHKTLVKHSVTEEKLTNQSQLAAKIKAAEDSVKSEMRKELEAERDRQRKEREAIAIRESARQERADCFNYNNITNTMLFAAVMAGRDVQSIGQMAKARTYDPKHSAAPAVLDDSSKQLEDQRPNQDQRLLEYVASCFLSCACL